MKAFVTVRATIEAEYEIDDVKNLDEARDRARDLLYGSFTSPGLKSDAVTGMCIERVSAEDWD